MTSELNNLPLGHGIRLGRISTVGDTFVEVEFFDRFISNSVRCPIPHLYAGHGGGVLIGPEKDTMVIVASGPGEKWYIVGFVPDLTFFGDLDNAANIRYNESPYPRLGQGEVALKGRTGQTITLTNDGNLSLDANIGSKGASLELSPFSGGLFVRTDNIYRFTEAGREVEGVVKRDINDVENITLLGGMDFLAGEAYDELLTMIGRSPVDEVHARTAILSKETVRNPALIEKREIIYEYADSFGVKGFDKEIDSMKKVDPQNLQVSIENLQVDPTTREHRRSDVLDLNLRNYNHLIERIQGTVVDIYGNILDINRNIIKVPSVEGFSTIGDNRDLAHLRLMYDYLRRSIKYHFEINSRKPLSATEPSAQITGIGKDHSRFSIDIDAEGFTKINIPASSETGNIPILSRHFVSRDPNAKDNGSFRDENGRDVRISQFGAKEGNSFTGTTIANAEYLPETTDGATVTVGTAYHDMFKVAKSIFEKGKHGGAPTLSSTVTNEIGNTQANAGGRSLHINMDGSMEVSVGADTVDNKSLVMDLQGGMLSHFGRDKNGRSIIHQSDGDVLIQIGGVGVADGDGRFDNSDDRPGRLEIHLNRAGAEPQKIVIDENGITIAVEGNAVYSATGDMTISSSARLLLQGEMIFLHGTHDTDIKGTRGIQGVERYVLRNGNIVM